MSLPNIKSGKTRRCHAKAKSTKQQCKNPAAYGMSVCRFHGARKMVTVRSGDKHPMYRHGECSKEFRARYSEKVRFMLEIENLALRIGLIESRSRGRRPK